MKLYSIKLSLTINNEGCTYFYVYCFYNYNYTYGIHNICMYFSLNSEIFPIIKISIKLC